jgi:hypothetical protein
MWCERRTIEGGGGKERALGGGSTSHTHTYEDSTMKLTKYCLKREGRREEG